MNRKTLFVFTLGLGVALTACNSKNPSVLAQSQPQQSPQNVVPASASLSADQKPVSAPMAAQGLAIETTANLSGGDWAMRQDAIKNDPNGQWAVTASASSSYKNAAGHDDYSPFQVIGQPNVEKEGDDINAWCPAEADSGLEWLDVTFTKRVYAASIRIRESYNAGAVAKVELYDEQGAAHTLWTGTDPTTGLNYFVLNFPKTTFKTNRVKVYLATNVIAGYQEIDAIQLVGAEQ